MPARRLAILMLALSGAVAASRASAPVLPLATRALAPAGTAHLKAFGSRGTEQRVGGGGAKLDAALAELVRHAALVRPEHALADLHALNPAVRFRQSADSSAPLVLIDAVTGADPQRLKSALESLGLEQAAVFANDVGGWLPVSRIDAAAARPELLSIRAAMMRTRAGAVARQGDYAQGSSTLRIIYPTLTGAGLTVGVLSDSFDCYAQYARSGFWQVPASGPEGYAQNGFLADAAQDEASGALPPNVAVLEEAVCMSYGAPESLPFSDEGRAMLQIVHAVAPGANLAFYSADGSEADYAYGIGVLSAFGARVEVDDTFYFDEPFFQDGIVAQAIDGVEAQGVAYFSAAGNDGSVSYDNTAPSFATLSSSGPNAGEHLLNFDASGATTTTSLPVTLPALSPGEFFAIVIEWDQPYVTGAPGSPGASSQIDLCITAATASDPIITDVDGDPVACTGPNALGVDPVQMLIVGNPAYSGANTAAESVTLILGLAGGTPAPGRIKIALDADGAPISINAFATPTPTLQGHAGAAGAMAVGAAFFPETPRCGVSPALLESYSSEGGEPILFDTSGSRLATPEIRLKPDLVGPDGVNTSFFGQTLASIGVGDDSTVSECRNDASYPNFFGTSAAAPHLAGGAALLLQANTALRPAQVYDALRLSAAPMGAPVPNFQSGYGFVQIDAALAQLPHAVPSASRAAPHSGGGALDGGTLLALALLACVHALKGARSRALPARQLAAGPPRRSLRRSTHRARHRADARARSRF
jgi:Subtilase family